MGCTNKFFVDDYDAHIFDGSVLNARFTEQEVEEVIQNFKSGKAAGTDSAEQIY